jgi:hypothetical protein
MARVNRTPLLADLFRLVLHAQPSDCSVNGRRFIVNSTHYGMCCFVMIISVVVFIAMARPASAQSRMTSREQFLPALAESMSKLEDEYSQVSGTFTYTVRVPSDRAEVVSEREFAVDKDRSKVVGRLVKQTKDPKTIGQIMGYVGSPEYSFQVKRLPDRQEYLLVNYGTDSKSDLRPHNRNHLYMLAAVYQLNSFPLRRLIGHPTFVVKKLSDERQAEEQFVRVEFTVSPNRPTLDASIPKDVVSLAGWFTVSPEHGWAVREYEYTMQGERKVTFRGAAFYPPASGKPPVPTKVIRSSTWGDKQGGEEQLDDIRVTFGPVPREQFTLSYFGLPEPLDMPNQPAVKSTPYYVWILIAAAGCGAIALAFFRARRRRLLPQTVIDARGVQ